MGTSSITVTALTATPTLRGNKLAAVVLATGPAANIPQLMLANVEFYASTANDFATAAIVGEGNPDFLHAGLIEEQVYYYWARPRAVNGSYGAVYPVSPTAGVACTAIGMSGLAFGLANGKLVASVAGNALTVAIKTAAGNDPSADDPVFVGFASSTLTIGAYQVRRITAACSLVISNGSLLATENNAPFRLWAVLFDDAGTLRLGLTNRSFTSGWLFPLPDGGIASSTAEGGAGGADGNLIYTGAAVTSMPYRIVGTLDWSSGLATVGAWSAPPDVVRMTIPGTTPGQLIQEFRTQSFSPDAGTATIPSDGSAPQIGEGTQHSFGVSFTPLAAANWLEIEALMHASVSVAGEIIIALFRGGAASAVASAVAEAAVADKIVPICLNVRLRANSIAAQAFTLNFGPAAASTVTFNPKLGNTLYSFFAIRELRG